MNQHPAHVSNVWPFLGGIMGSLLNISGNILVITFPDIAIHWDQVATYMVNLGIGTIITMGAKAAWERITRKPADQENKEEKP